MPVKLESSSAESKGVSSTALQLSTVGLEMQEDLVGSSTGAAEEDLRNGLDGGTPIVNFYRGKHVLVTGATGFMGKVLVEKLLRSCSSIGKIYLLMRPKKRQDIFQRLKDMTDAQDYLPGMDFLSNSSSVSEEMTWTVVHSFSDEALLCETVSVVFHSAATVKFDEALKTSVDMNVLGTRRLLVLAKKMKGLQSFVHVSTAYCNCNRSEVFEYIYPAPTDPDNLIHMTEWMDNNLLEEITPKLIGDRPNTYTYTKALAETLIFKESRSLPLAIVRPSIVTGAWKEPIPGWVDSLNGATGLFVGAGKGVLRSILCTAEKRADFVPVDVPINLMITVGWYTGTRRDGGKLLIYNCVSGERNPILWDEIQIWGNRILRQNPFNDAIWYPSGTFTSHYWLNNIQVFFLHLIPAHVIDLLSILVGKKPRMIRLHSRIAKAIRALEYFTTNEWQFFSKNVPHLLSQMDPRDAAIFDFDIKKIDWENYLEDYCMGTKLFVLKEDRDSIKKARNQLRRQVLKYCRILLHITLAVCLLRYYSHHMNVFKRIWFYLMSLVIRVHHFFVKDV
ncbi:unnamed protein product [Cyprideis torosa]|uniref:Fatty acyl-CoA reductase n=1 Tax=Cyprideis torosa TaxID=163714 RepID=A0A7R8W5C0_9CRUS|nr:unnamed protein product [Cyprideis torosa]CAG0880705.1 unnamed protein product [Cyprideis torosa]